MKGPSSHGFFDLQPDGAWATVVDSMGRLVVVSAGTMGPYLVSIDDLKPAWYIPGETTYTIEISPAG